MSKYLICDALILNDIPQLSSSALIAATNKIPKIVKEVFIVLLDPNLKNFK
jgi:hypothetical protein